MKEVTQRHRHKQWSWWSSHQLHWNDLVSSDVTWSSWPHAEHPQCSWEAMTLLCLAQMCYGELQDPKRVLAQFPLIPMAFTGIGRPWAAHQTRKPAACFCVQKRLKIEAFSFITELKSQKENSDPSEASLVYSEKRCLDKSSSLKTG